MLRTIYILAALATSTSGGTYPALSWGDEGHEIVGAIAERYLDPAVHDKVSALLAADNDALTAPDFVSRTTWADRWRDSDRNTSKVRYNATQAWHFVDIEIASPDLDAACFGHPSVASGSLASSGVARDCVVDKVEEFAAELADVNLPQAERVLALKYLLHFIGDLHQPLHASDNHDRGGNDVSVLYGRRGTAERLHAYWDTTVVQRMGRDPRAVADNLVGTFESKREEWSAGKPRNWAVASFAVARDVAYKLPGTTEPDERGTQAYRLDEGYETAAVAAAREQLAKAGFRLAKLLNASLGK